MKRWVVFGACMFVVGFAVGNLGLLNARPNNKQPLDVDFCFLLRNPDLIGSRRFATHANIVTVFPHGLVLESDSCPEMATPFAEHLDGPDHVSEQFKRKFSSDPYDFASVSTTFEGTLYRPSLVHRMWFRLRGRFGIWDRRPPITIRAFKAIENYKTIGDQTSGISKVGK